MESDEKTNIELIDKYCEHYLGKYSTDKTSRIKLKSSNFSLKDYENLKYLIKSLNTSSQDPSILNTKYSYSQLKKANKLGVILWKHIMPISNDPEVLKTVSKLRSLTLNNLGCYFQSLGKFTTSLDYIEKATKIEKKGNVEEYEIATTLLNLSAVLSNLGNHTDALQRSFEAVTILEKLDEEKEIPEALSAAYYNYAVELEYLERYHESKINYERAYELSKKKLGESHMSTVTFLDKLVQFNFTHALELDVRPSSKTTAGKSVSVSPIVIERKGKEKEKEMENEKEESQGLDVMHQQYKTFGTIRFKIIVINKHDKESLKILAFPENKYPVYRLVVKYDKVLEVLDLPGGGDFKEVVGEEFGRNMKRLIDVLAIEKGALKMNNNSLRSRPFSAGNNFIVTAEKYGARFTATLTKSSFYDSNQFK